MAPYPGTDFVEYAVYRTDVNPEILVGTVTDQNQTSFIHTDATLDLEAASACYKVLVQNTCLEYSELDATEAHCTVELETTQGTDAITLDWTPYVGFEVGTYEVYRTNTYDLSVPPQLIATLPGLEITYTDRETFCRDSISYRVLAIGLEVLMSVPTAILIPMHLSTPIQSYPVI